MSDPSSLRSLSRRIRNPSLWMGAALFVLFSLLHAIWFATLATLVIPPHEMERMQHPGEVLPAMLWEVLAPEMTVMCLCVRVPEASASDSTEQWFFVEIPRKMTFEEHVWVAFVMQRPEGIDDVAYYNMLMATQPLLSKQIWVE